MNSPIRFTTFELSALRVLDSDMVRFVANVPERVRSSLHRKGAIRRGRALSITSIGLAALAVSRVGVGS